MRTITSIFILLSLLACNRNTFVDDGDINEVDLGSENDELYFPPLNNDTWEKTEPSSIGWRSENLPALYDLLEENETRAFIVLIDGKIVIEEYFGKDLLNLADFDKNDQWYWASAGKTLTAVTTGLAQEQGYLNIQEKSSEYLGQGWTSLEKSQEDKITVWHQLTMTSGLDDRVNNSDNTNPEALQYKAEPGTRWAYHNAPYTLLDGVIEGATDLEFETYFNTHLRDKIGMDGSWLWLEDNHVYFSTARSMARFGLLISNNGDWDGNTIIQDKSFIKEMTNQSQDINYAYGYLWWLNGKQDYMLPGLQLKIPGSITPEAPADMISGIGKNGQYVSVIPSLNMVMVRMGNNPDEVSVPILFQKDIWKAFNEVIN